MAVEPNLIASREYSTWKRRPSGEKVLLWLLRTDYLMGFERYSILYATVCKRYQLVDKKVEARIKSLPYSDRAMNIMKAERRKQT